MKLKSSTLAIATALAIASPIASAQAGGVTAALEGVQAAVRALTATVNQLLTSVNQLVSAHNVTPAGVTKLATSQVEVKLNQIATCSAVNVGPVPITFVTRMIGLGGVQVFEYAHSDVRPGTGTYIAGVLIDTSVRCEFTGASLVNLRANLVVYGNLPAGQIAVSEAR